MTEKKQFNFSRAVLKWFEAYGRKHLPWQQNPCAYRVWISEIMLQQTQVTAVVPYFERFMAEFPDVNALASASIDQVLAHWAGLGYYARARNLHKTAQIIAHQHQGEFPKSIEALEALPGIGRSTAGAILSLGHHQWAPILDGNVKRVLARFFALEGWPGTPANVKQLWQWSEELTPKKRSGEYNQAMMDIGATVCTRSQPKCCICPLKNNCRAQIQNLQQQIPQAKPQKERPIKSANYCLIINQKTNSLLLEQRPLQGIWGGLWVCPEWTQEKTLADWLRDDYQLILLQQCFLSEFRHTFTHFHLDITPILAIVRPKSKAQVDVAGKGWYKINSLKQVGLPAPIKKMVQSLFLSGVIDDTHRILQKTE